MGMSVNSWKRPVSSPLIADQASFQSKKQSRRTFSRNPSEFLNAVRAHHKAKKAADRLGQQRSARKQEKAFRNNPWKFSKSVCEDHSLPQPTFSMQTCLEFFQSTHSNDHVSYTKLPDWISEVMPTPDIQVDFDLSPITYHPWLD